MFLIDFKIMLHSLVSNTNMYHVLSVLIVGRFFVLKYLSTKVFFWISFSKLDNTSKYAFSSSAAILTITTVQLSTKVVF